MFEISLNVTPAQHIAVEAILEDLGTLSISLLDAEDEPVFVYKPNENPLWNKIVLTALFAKKPNLDKLRNTLEKVLACPIEISTRIIQEQDWQDTWKQGLQPMQFGERLWVCPSWCTSPDPFAINLRLDPGIAFGTGSHPTTALCLEWLAKNPPVNKQVADFGCGSGILAIASYFLGAKSITAIDHDTQATQATHVNLKHNCVPQDSFNIVTSTHLDTANYDLIMANVLLKPLIELEYEFARSVVTNGKIILSGILQQQLPELSQCYKIHFNIDNISTKNEWLLIAATRR